MKAALPYPFSFPLGQKKIWILGTYHAHDTGIIENVFSVPSSLSHILLSWIFYHHG